MFASENLLLHDTISTLELKNYNVRWYAKEALLTDRALYLYKKNSNYVHDAHRKYCLAYSTSISSFCLIPLLIPIFCNNYREAHTCRILSTTPKSWSSKLLSGRFATAGGTI